MWGYGMKPKIQSIYFAKDAIADANEHGVRMLLRELRYKVYRDETFLLMVSIIDLDVTQEYHVLVNLIDESTDKDMYTIDGSLKTDPSKVDKEKNGFILMESISNLPPATNSHCVVRVQLFDSNETLLTEGQTILLTSREVNPYGE